MLRSFSYAAYAGLFAHICRGRASSSGSSLGADLADVDERGVSSGYFATAGRLCSFRRITQRDALLELFVLDKALYELNYELNNRPTGCVSRSRLFSPSSAAKAAPRPRR